MDIALLQAVIVELSENISGARIAKIHQPAIDQLIVKLWNGKENLRLLISAASGDSRIHLTVSNPPNPFTPPRFCQLLRARLSRIVSVSQVNNDRVVQIKCSGPDGDYRLMVELCGRSSNMVLVDANDVIVDSLKRVSTENVDRVILPGTSYSLPIKHEHSVEKMQQIIHGDSVSPSKVMDDYYMNGVGAGTVKDIERNVKQLIRREHKKISRRLKKIEIERLKQREYAQNRLFGDLLLANLHSIQRGMVEVEVEDFSIQPPIVRVIPLDPLLSPQQNAERFYNRYKKARRGLEHSERRMQETIDEIDWIENLDFQLEDSNNIEEIVIELQQAGILKEKKSRLPGPRNSVAEGRFSEVISPSGLRIVWGRNNKQNDYLSTKLKNKNDLWFHANRYPGAHVLLRIEPSNIEIRNEDIHFAASIAAGYSKARNANNVEVMVVAAKNVYKPKGARPGLVSVREFKTVMVKPFRIEVDDNANG